MSIDHLLSRDYRLAQVEQKKEKSNVYLGTNP